ncbi:pilus assembly protein PilB [Nocardioides sp. MAH-18]|uniref:Pilus assembly protein PilB n=1 Tax=Nocardioides agri TaxID=2682843 RepID=A0A6L6XYM9_9ACTN|nr:MULTISPECIES: GspE/PulE family protein [unclassified Nocardioides]MBA2952730.1 type II/IV secretion system protein [Nocardioides sp. CGMCC 1.13656]MVQ51892.1 pilus assembly protein PilB [Nocardioides sp. MAH-18]
MKLRSRSRDEQSASASVGPDAYDERLAEALVASRRLEPHQVDAARSIDAGGSLAEQLIGSGVMTDEDLAHTLAAHYGVDEVDFRHTDPDAAAVALLPQEAAHALRALPIAIEDEHVVVAVVDPSPERRAELASALGRSARLVVATHADLERALASEYKATREVEGQIQAFEARDSLRREADQLETAQVNEDAPVVQVVQMIITQGLRDRASDIHIEPSGDRVRVRYRIDGALADVLDLPGSIGPAIVSRVKILSGMNIVERRRAQDGQISMVVEGRDVDIRVASTAVVGGEKVVMRLLDKSRSLFRLEQLGMPSDTADRYSQLIHAPYGMVICAGPTGGGKTTTLYASLGELNTPERNIMTIEDPVEYTFDSINQIQINEPAGVTFSGGLRSILRQDPDVILVGEIRDVDTARIAVQSALTGHLVLSSLHATEAVSALYRLLDMGIESFLIASSVTAVVAQRLVRRSCTSCLEPYSPSPEELAFLRRFGDPEVEVEQFLRGVGCHFCSHTGFLERIGVYELLAVTDQVRELIVDRAPHDEMRKLASSQGMRTLQEQAARLVRDGTTTAAEVMRSIYIAGV